MLPQKKLKDIYVNDGIFVFDLKNQRDLNVINNFTKEEKKFLRDFYKNSNIKQYKSDYIAEKKRNYLQYWNMINQRG